MSGCSGLVLRRERKGRARRVPCGSPVVVALLGILTAVLPKPSSAQ